MSSPGSKAFKADIVARNRDCIRGKDACLAWARKKASQALRERIKGGVYDEYEAPLRQSPPASAPGPFEPQSPSRTPPATCPTPSAKRRPRKKKRVIDETRSIEYTDGDVLFGRGGFACKHPGNIKFRQKALELRPWYESVAKEEKYKISDLLVESVEAEGRRFLEKGSDGLWYEVIGNGPRKKASQALRQRINIKRSSAKGRENDPGGQCDVRRPGSGQCAGIDRGH